MSKIESLKKQIETGKMVTDAARILNYVKKNKYTSQPMISDALGIKRQTVSGRVSDLLDMGFLEIVNTEQKALYDIYKFQYDEYKRMQNAHQRKYSKYLAWKKKGEEFVEFEEA